MFISVESTNKCLVCPSQLNSIKSLTEIKRFCYFFIGSNSLLGCFNGQTIFYCQLSSNMNDTELIDLACYVIKVGALLNLRLFNFPV